MCCKLNIQVRRDSDVFPGQWHHPFLTSPLTSPLTLCWALCKTIFPRNGASNSFRYPGFTVRLCDVTKVIVLLTPGRKKTQQHRVLMLEKCVSVLLTMWGRHVIFNPLCYKMLCQQCGSYLRVITHGPTFWLGSLSLFTPVIWVMSLHNTNSVNVDAQR